MDILKIVQQDKLDRVYGIQIGIRVRYFNSPRPAPNQLHSLPFFPSKRLNMNRVSVFEESELSPSQLSGFTISLLYVKQ